MTSISSNKIKAMDLDNKLLSLAYNPSISRTIRLLETTSGVDKLIRTIQFTSRFVAFYAGAPGPQTTSPQPTGLAAIRKQFGLSRKLLRLGNTIVSLRALAQAINDPKQTDFVDKWAAVAQHAGFAAFATVDSATYFQDAGICRIPRIRLLEKLAFVFWLWALVASILGNIYRLQRIKQRLAKLLKNNDDNNDNEKKNFVKPLQAESREVGLQILGAGCDALFPAYGLGFPIFTKLDDGMLGMAGSISSFVGLRGAWKATKST